MTLANAMLSEAQARESRQTITKLSQDLALIDDLLMKTDGRSKVVHVIDLPFGKLALHIKRRSDADAR
jgi:hypothetical protein